MTIETKRARRARGPYKRGPRKPAAAEAQLVPAVAGAREKGIPYTTLRDAALRGELPVVKFGRAWYFERRDLDRFVANAKQTLKA